MNAEVVRDKPLRVLILGYGEMGHAMAYLLESRCDLQVWQRRAQGGKGGFDPAKAAANSDVVLFCVPTQPHFELLERLLPSLSRTSLCVTVAKGLDDRGRPAARVFREVLGDVVPYAVLHGPMIAEELRAGRPGFAQVGAAKKGVFARVRTLFAGTSLFLRHSVDEIGLAWAAVLKNIYAMAFGIADELGYGDNVRGYLTVAAIREMTGIIHDMGGISTGASDLAGLGDLVTTATSAGSHHHDLGRRIARGECAGLEGEAIHAIERIRALSLFDIERYPLCRFIVATLREGVQSADFLRYLDAAHAG